MTPRTHLTEVQLLAAVLEEGPDSTSAQLEQARSADAAWRTERSTSLQRRIDASLALETRGRHWTRTPGQGFFLAGTILTFVSAGLFAFFVSSINSILIWVAITPPLLGFARVLMGLFLFGLGRLERRLWVQIARRADIEIADLDDVTFFDLTAHDPPKSDGG